jgi:23S rRNA pseudouridine2605 synthase
MKSETKSAAKKPENSLRAAKTAKPAKKKTGSRGEGRETGTAASPEIGAARKAKTKAARTARMKAEPDEPELKSGAKAARRRTKSEESVPKKAKSQAKLKSKATKPQKEIAEQAEDAKGFRTGEPVLDPIGDTTDGEGRTALDEPQEEGHAGEGNAELDAFRKETQIEASDAILEAGPGMEATQEAREAKARIGAVESAASQGAAGDAEGTEPREDEKLERLQKILSQAGIASRRRAEEMITAGRVMVNGQVVTALGTKADVARDHIRVDGKLLHGAERHRYFLLNKPKGYVTTVSDPEGRPTVMKFFEKMPERLYPVGRLDYQSEGLLLMTNDGELANLLTKAGSGVEKTYLVKVAGQLTEEQLQRLRSGVTIVRAEEGSGRVRTAPARVRQVRVGDNPWFEVVLIEGRNRELRKMFAAVGHFVEKIRRVGYGPLALDIEPGKLRELTADEVTALRLTAEGKMKPRLMDAGRMLPKDAGLAAEKRDEKRGRRDGRGFGRRDSWRSNERGRNEFRPREGGGTGRREGADFQRRERAGFAKGEGGGFAGRERRDFGKREGGFRGRRDEGAKDGRQFGGPKPRFERPRFERPGPGGEPRRDPKGGGFDKERKPFRERGQRGFGAGERKPFRQGGERRPGQGAGKPFGERGERKFDGERKPFRPQGDRPFFKRGPKPEGSGGDFERREDRGPRQEAPAVRGQAKRFGSGKPRFGTKPGGFGGKRREGGRGGARPGGFGGSRGGDSRAGGGRGSGGRKRG